MSTISAKDLTWALLLVDDRIKLANDSANILQDIINRALTAFKKEAYHEDMGNVLWWKFPVEEPPYVGSPLSYDWSDRYTHFTPLIVPEEPKQ